MFCLPNETMALCQCLPRVSQQSFILCVPAWVPRAVGHTVIGLILTTNCSMRVNLSESTYQHCNRQVYSASHLMTAQAFPTGKVVQMMDGSYSLPPWHRLHPTAMAAADHVLCRELWPAECCAVGFDFSAGTVINVFADNQNGVRHVKFCVTWTPDSFKPFFES